MSNTFLIFFLEVEVPTFHNVNVSLSEGTATDIFVVNAKRHITEQRHTKGILLHTFFLIWPEMLVLVVFIFNTNNPFY